MIEGLLEKQLYLENTLTPHQLKYIHSKSIRNFLNYLPYIKSEGLRGEIINELHDYFDVIEKKNYELTKHESGDLSIKYLRKIGSIYKVEFNFRLAIIPKYAFFIGIHIDLLLLLLGFLKEIYYIPVITILLGGYSLALKIFYRNKLYGHWY